eukprot:4387093-Prymnesium_polylepis.1
MVSQRHGITAAWCRSGVARGVCRGCVAACVAAAVSRRLEWGFSAFSRGDGRWPESGGVKVGARWARGGGVKVGAPWARGGGVAGVGVGRYRRTERVSASAPRHSASRARATG